MTLNEIPAWSDIESQPWFASLTPEEKQQSLTKWQGDMMQFAKDPKEKFAVAATSKAKARSFFGEEMPDDPIADALQRRQKDLEDIGSRYDAFSKGELEEDDEEVLTLNDTLKGNTPYSVIKGRLFVSPQLVWDKAAYEKVVNEAPVDEDERVLAMSAYDGSKERAAEGVVNSLGYTDEEFRDFAAKGFKEGKSNAAILDEWKANNKLPEGILGSLRGVGRQAYFGLRSGLSGLERAMGGLGGFFGSESAQKYAEESGKEAQSYMQRTLGEGPEFIGELTSGAVSIIPTIAAGAAASFFTEGAALPAAASITAGAIQSAGATQAETYEFYRNQGLDHANALAESRVDGLVSGLITGAITHYAGKLGDKIGLGKGIEGLFSGPASKIASKLTQREISESLKAGAKAVGGSFLQEGSEELLDQAAQDAYSMIKRDPTLTLAEAINNALQAGKVGAVLGGAAEAGKLGLNSLLNSAKFSVPTTEEEEALRAKFEVPAAVEEEIIASPEVQQEEQNIKTAADVVKEAAPVAPQTAAVLAGITEEKAGELAADVVGATEDALATIEAEAPVVATEPPAEEAPPPAEAPAISPKPPVSPASEPAPIGETQPPAAASMPMMVTREMNQQLADLGYSRKERNALRPEQAAAIIAAGVRKEKPVSEQPPQGQPIETPTNAAPEITLEESLRQEPQDRVEVGTPEETGVGDSVQRAAEGEKEVAVQKVLSALQRHLDSGGEFQIPGNPPVRVTKKNIGQFSVSEDGSLVFSRGKKGGKIPLPDVAVIGAQVGAPFDVLSLFSDENAAPAPVRSSALAIAESDNGSAFDRLVSLVGDRGKASEEIEILTSKDVFSAWPVLTDVVADSVAIQKGQDVDTQAKADALRQLYREAADLPPSKERADALEQIRLAASLNITNEETLKRRKKSPPTTGAVPTKTLPAGQKEVARSLEERFSEIFNSPLPKGDPRRAEQDAELSRVRAARDAARVAAADQIKVGDRIKNSNTGRVVTVTSIDPATGRVDFDGVSVGATYMTVGDFVPTTEPATAVKKSTPVEELPIEDLTPDKVKQALYARKTKHPELSIGDLVWSASKGVGTVSKKLKAKATVSYDSGETEQVIEANSIPPNVAAWLRSRSMPAQLPSPPTTGAVPTKTLPAGQKVTPGGVASPGVARDTSKPEQMTPEEFFSMAGEDSELSRKYHQEAMSRAEVIDKTPISVEAWDSYFSYPPAGYVKQGELYVYEKTQPLPKGDAAGERGAVAPAPTVEPAPKAQPVSQPVQAFRDAVSQMSPTAQAKWTPELRATAEAYLDSGGTTGLQGLSDVQQKVVGRFLPEEVKAAFDAEDARKRAQRNKLPDHRESSLPPTPGKQIRKIGKGAMESVPVVLDEIAKVIPNIRDLVEVRESVEGEPDAEGFYDPQADKAVVLVNNVYLKPQHGGSQEAALRETIIHELLHRGFAKLRQTNPQLFEQFEAYSLADTNDAQFEALVRRGYSMYSNWKDDPAQNQKAREEIFIRKAVVDLNFKGIEAIKSPTSLASQFFSWLRGLLNKLLGRKVDDETLLHWSRVFLNAAQADFIEKTPGERSFSMGRDLLSPEKYARHAELEAKHNAGTITPEETAEAQALVEEAARGSYDSQDSRSKFSDLLGGRDTPTVDFSVLGRINNSKVLDPIVESIPIQMMDMLGSKERASDVILNNPSVFENALSYVEANNLVGKPLIARLRDKTQSVVAAARAALSLAPLASLDREMFSAIHALQNNLISASGYQPSIGDFGRRSETGETKDSRVPSDDIALLGAKPTGPSGKAGGLYLELGSTDFASAFNAHRGVFTPETGPTQENKYDPFTGVPLEQRFQPTSPDIRYSLGEPPDMQAEADALREVTPSSQALDKFRETFGTPRQDVGQVLGKKEGSVYTQAQVAPLIEYARSMIGFENDANGDPIINPEATQKALNMVANLNGRPGFASQFNVRAAEVFKGKPVDPEIATAVLTQELQVYANRLSASSPKAEDQILKVALTPFYNTQILGSYLSRRIAGRTLQAASMASGETGDARKSREEAEKAVDREITKQLGDEALPAAEGMDKAGVEGGVDAIKDDIPAPADPTLRLLDLAVESLDEVAKNLSEKTFRKLLRLGRLQDKAEGMKKVGNKALSVFTDKSWLEEPLPDTLEEIEAEAAKLREELSKDLADLDAALQGAKPETRKKVKTKAAKTKSKTDSVQKLIDKLASMPDEAKEAKPKAETLRAAIADTIKEKEFDEQKVRDAATKFGATPEQTERLVEEAERIHEIRQSPKLSKAKLRQFLLSFPKNVLANPEQREALLRSFLKGKGYSEAEINRIVPQVLRDFDAGYQKARKAYLDELEKKLKPKQGQKESKQDQQNRKMLNALRSGLADTTSEASVALAKSLGFEAFRPQDDHILSKLDEEMRKLREQDRISDANAKFVQIRDLLNRRRPPRDFMQVAAQGWITSALSSLSNFAVNVWAPLGEAGVRFTSDILRAAATGKIDEIPLYLEAAIQALKSMPPRAKFAFKTDTFTNSVNTLIADMASMKDELQRALNTYRSKDSSKLAKAAAAGRILFTIGDLSRRVLSTVDDTWYTALSSYIGSSNLIKDLRDAKLPKAAVQAIAFHANNDALHQAQAEHATLDAVSQFVESLRGKTEEEIDAGLEYLGLNDASVTQAQADYIQEIVSALQSLRIRSGATGDDLVKRALKEISNFKAAVNVRAVELGQARTKELLATALTEVGQTPQQIEEAQRNYDENAKKAASFGMGLHRVEGVPSYDIMGKAVQIVDAMGRGAVTTSPLLGRMMVGFFGIPLNLLNKSLWFTPYGLGRYFLAKWQMAKNPEEKFYEYSMSSQREMSQRVNEIIIGHTIMAAAFALGAIRDQEDEEGEGLYITLGGPSNKTEYDAWYARGFRKFSFCYKTKDGSVAAVPYGRGMGEVLKMPLMLLGAFDDMRLNKKLGDREDMSSIIEYLNSAAAGIGNQATFLGAKNTVGAFAPDKIGANTASSIAYAVSNLVPFNGLDRSIAALAVGPPDRSRTGAILANIPIARWLATDPAINVFGDKWGNKSDANFAVLWDRQWNQGLIPLNISAPLTGQDKRLYGFIGERLIGPSPALRGALELRNGYVTDKQWYDYSIYRGQALKREMVTQLDRLRRMDDDSLSKAIAELSTKATKKAKDRFNYK